MKIILTNNNLKEVRELLTLKNIKPNSDLVYYLSFGFKSDKEQYFFEIQSEIIAVETFITVPIKTKKPRKITLLPLDKKDSNLVFRVGQYKGMKLNSVKKIDTNYIHWCETIPKDYKSEMLESL